jgi:hypothetical protein
MELPTKGFHYLVTLVCYTYYILLLHPIDVPGRLRVLFPGNTPEHQYLRRLGMEMLARPTGVTGDHTPYSCDYGAVNGSCAADSYKVATGRPPSGLLEIPAMGRYFVKRSHRRSGNILTFSAPVLEYLLGLTNTAPSKCTSADLHVTGAKIQAPFWAPLVSSRSFTSCNSTFLDCSVTCAACLHVSM